MPPAVNPPRNPDTPRSSVTNAIRKRDPGERDPGEAARQAVTDGPSQVDPDRTQSGSLGTVLGRRTFDESGQGRPGAHAREVESMRVLVTYASRHGATKGIAERIAEQLRIAGLNVDALPATSSIKLAGYDAFVIGSAAYMGHWMKEARDLVRRNGAVLAQKPVWLFSSGPVGSEAVDAKGRDQKVAAVPTEIAEIRSTINARDHRVFFGAYERDRKPIGFAERLAAPFLSALPAAREALPVGDFRDWPEIDGWAAEIARDLTVVTAG